jgi:hypothetical protein
VSTVGMSHRLARSGRVLSVRPAIMPACYASPCCHGHGCAPTRP